MTGHRFRTETVRVVERVAGTYSVELCKPGQAPELCRAGIVTADEANRRARAIGWLLRCSVRPFDHERGR